MSSLLRSGELQFLSDLIAKANQPQFAPDVAKVIAVVTAKLGRSGLEQHARELGSLANQHPAIYRAALRGDFENARDYVDAVADTDERDRLVRLLARQRIIWSAADIHRVAGRGNSARKHYIPWYLRLVVADTASANGYLGLLRTGARDVLRLVGFADRVFSEKPEQTRVHVRGTKPLLIRSVLPAARVIEDNIDDKVKKEIVETRVTVSQGLEDLAEQIDDVLHDPDRSNQQTIHQFQNANLSEVAATFVTAYRFAEDEAKMLAVIENPAICDALWNRTPPAFPVQVVNGFAIRARHLVAAYRPAILRDPVCTPYDPGDIRLGETSEADAWDFIERIGGKDNRTIAEGGDRIAHILDLSHWAR